MKLISFLLATALPCVASMTSCNKETPDHDDSSDNPYTAIVLTKGEAVVANNANIFAFNAYQALYEGHQMLFSPLSLSLALSMTACGADGSTAEQMTGTLGFAGLSAEDIAGYYQKMVKNLASIDKKTTFESANSIWIDNGFTVKEGFLTTVKDRFAAEIKDVPIKDPSTVDAINAWCSDKTHGKIDKMLDKLNPDCVMALVNALYFNGTWGFKFEEKTEKEVFTTIGKKEVKVDMMNATHTLDYALRDGWAMVDLPYGNGAFRMSVILPPEDMRMDMAAKSFDYELWKTLHSCASPRTVYLKMPEFKFEYQADGLKEVLSGLGMVEAFRPVADFSKIADIPYGDAFFIGDVKQKTFIDVNTKGTEAAAVTVVEMNYVTSVGPREEPLPVHFTADRPFFFLIREKSTDSILFIGQKVE